MTLRQLLPCLLLMFVGWKYLGPEKLPPAGVAVPEKPQQVLVNAPVSWDLAGGKYRAWAEASCRVRARVLDVRRAHDDESSYGPCSLVLGWGRASDSAVYGLLDVSQRERAFTYGWSRRNPPMTNSEVGCLLARCTIIPGYERVAKVLATVRRHDVVRLTGVLVALRGTTGYCSRYQPLGAPSVGGSAATCNVVRVSDLTIEPPDAP